MGHYLADMLPDDLDFEACMALSSACRFMKEPRLTEYRKELVQKTKERRERIQQSFHRAQARTKARVL
jgi:hypothetical protein